jgi:hypothetical protein
MICCALALVDKSQRPDEYSPLPFGARDCAHRRQKDPSRTGAQLSSRCLHSPESLQSCPKLCCQLGFHVSMASAHKTEVTRSDFQHRWMARSPRYTRHHARHSPVFIRDHAGDSTLGDVHLKKRGNPNWGKPVSESFSSTRPTSFEEAAASLGLSPRDYHKSKALHEWVTRNKNSKYVPSDLLKAWGLEVKVDM